MATTNRISRDAALAAAAADDVALRAYVDALPDADRIAWYRANPDYMVDGMPASLLADAMQLSLAGDVDGAGALLRRHYLAQCELAAIRRRRLTAPRTGDRVAGAIVGASGPGLFGLLGTLAAGALHQPAAVAALATLTVVLTTFGALCGAVTGGK